MGHRIIVIPAEPKYEAAVPFVSNRRSFCEQPTRHGMLRIWDASLLRGACIGSGECRQGLFMLCCVSGCSGRMSALGYASENKTEYNFKRGCIKESCREEQFAFSRTKSLSTMMDGSKAQSSR
jgi:hypothetical protein